MSLAGDRPMLDAGEDDPLELTARPRRERSNEGAGRREFAFASFETIIKADCNSASAVAFTPRASEDTERFLLPRSGDWF